jgi:hypothetical protein
MALKKAVWFKRAARIWGLGKLTTSILQSVPEIIDPVFAKEAQNARSV